MAHIGANGDFEIRENQFGVIAVSNLSSNLELHWDARTGLQLQVLAFPRGDIDRIEIRGNLKTDVYAADLDEVLMKEIFVDAAASRHIHDERCPDSFDAVIELTPRSAENLHIQYSISSEFPLDCRIQVICKMFRNDVHLPSLAIILEQSAVLFHTQG